MTKSYARITQSQKIEYLENHFRYEVIEILYCIWFSYSAKQHRAGENQPLDSFLENTSMDHFLLHARNLLEFYYKTDKTDQYARATGFSPQWRPAKKSKAIRKLDRRVYSEITHLAWERLEVEEKNWVLSEVAVDLLLVTESFLDSLEAAYLTPKIVQLRNDSEQHRSFLQTGVGGQFSDMFKLIEEGRHLW